MSVHLNCEYQPKEMSDYLAERAEMQRAADEEPLPLRYRLGLEFWLGASLLMIAACCAVLYFMPELPR